MNSIALKICIPISLFSLLLFALSSCASSPTSTKVATPGFYHWKSQLQLSPSEQNALTQLAIQKLYIKFFDISTSPRAPFTFTPKTKIDWTSIPPQCTITPVVYLTIDCLRQLPEESLPQLAQQLLQSIKTLLEGRPLQHLQIDCDWTTKTREPYFQLLRLLQAQEPNLQLSTTIRLHQIKYRQAAGIPPVSKGLLMPYNLSDPTAYRAQNSIFDSKEAAKYLQNQSLYPLPLDIALPLFSWGIWFRDRQFRGFVRGLDGAEIAGASYLEPIKPPFFQVIKDTVIQQQYIRMGDEIKLEAVGVEALREALAFSLPILPNDSFDLLFFHLDEQVLKTYPYEQLQALCNLEL